MVCFDIIYLHVFSNICMKASFSVFMCLSSEQGIYVIGFSYPVVPKGKARIRVQISASHSEQDIDRAVDAFVTIGKELRVIG